MTAKLIFAALTLVAGLWRPAMAEPRWLACKFNDTSGNEQSFSMVFDDRRGTASLLDGVALIEGQDTSTTFQAVRTRFPQFILTYNRNDGALSVTPTAGGLGGILTGECRRIPPPPDLAPPDLPSQG